MPATQLVGTKKTMWRMGLTNLSTADSFKSMIPSVTRFTTQDTSAGVATNFFGAPIPPCANYLYIAPLGTNADAEAFDLQVWGICPVGETVDQDPNLTSTILWVPALMVQVAVTLSTPVGISGETPSDSHYFADTITFSYGDDDVKIVDNGQNHVSYFVLDAGCFTDWAVCTDRGTAASAGFLWAWS